MRGRRLRPSPNRSCVGKGLAAAAAERSSAAAIPYSTADSVRPSTAPTLISGRDETTKVAVDHAPAMPSREGEPVHCITIAQPTPTIATTPALITNCTALLPDSSKMDSDAIATSSARTTGTVRAMPRYFQSRPSWAENVADWIAKRKPMRVNDIPDVNTGASSAAPRTIMSASDSESHFTARATPAAAIPKAITTASGVVTQP